MVARNLIFYYIVWSSDGGEDLFTPLNINIRFLLQQAQQFDWVKEHYPTLFSEMAAYIKKGRFVPVGGTWVEMVSVFY